MAAFQGARWPALALSAWVTIAPGQDLLAGPKQDPWTPAGPSSPRAGALAALLASPTSGATFAAVQKALGPRDLHRTREALAALAASPTASAAARLAYAHWMLRAGEAASALGSLRTLAPTARRFPEYHRLLMAALEATAEGREPSDAAAALALRLETVTLLPSAPRLRPNVERILRTARKARRLRETMAVLQSHLPRVDLRRAAPALARAHAWLGQFTAAAEIAAREGIPLPHDVPVMEGSGPPEVPSRRAPPSAPEDRWADAAESKLAIGDEAEALRLYERLVARHPGFRRGVVGLGQLHHRQGRRAMALATWQRLLRAARPTRRARLDLATLLFEHREWEEAKAHAERARGGNSSEDVETHRLLGRIAAARDRPDEAISHWRAVHDQSDEGDLGKQARTQIAGLASSMNSSRQHRLLEDLEARWLEAEDPAARLRAAQLLAAVQATLGKSEEAIAILAAARQSSPRSTAITEQAVLVLKQSGRTAEALGWLEGLAEALRTGPPRDLAWAMREMAQLHQSRGDAQAALALLKEAHALAPSSRHAFRLARLTEQLAPTTEGAEQAQTWLAPFTARGDASATRAQMEVLARHGQWRAAFDLGRKAAGEVGERGGVWNAVLELCLAQPCAEELEHQLATRLEPSMEADEVHLRLLDQLAPTLGAAADGGNAEARERLRQLAEAGAAPLGRYLAAAVEAAPERIALAAYLATDDLARLLHARALAWVSQTGSETRLNFARGQAALWALGRMGAGLSQELAEKGLRASQQTRLLTLYALGAAGCSAPTNRLSAAMSPSDAVALLLEALEGRNEMDATVAVWALAQLPDDLAERAHARILIDAHRGAKVRAMAAAFARGTHHVRTLHALTTALTPPLRTAAVAGLWRLGSSEAKDFLRSVALGGEVDASRAARAALVTPASKACLSLMAPPTRVNFDAWAAAAAAPFAALRAPTTVAITSDDRAAMTRVFLEQLDRGGELETTRAVRRFASWTFDNHGGVVTPEMAARLAPLALSGPPAARAPAVALRAAAGAAVSPLEVVRALAAAELDDEEVDTTEAATLLVAAVGQLTVATKGEICAHLARVLRDDQSAPRQWLAEQLTAAIPGCSERGERM